MVPIATAPEWSAFYTHAPPGVGVSVCATCPTGFVRVPALAPYTSADFCVARYEMKNVGGVATSQATGTLWREVSRNTARTSCANLGSGYRLINNSEWQTIARDIASVGANWSTGTAGSGSLSRGHSTSDPVASVLEASADDDQGCLGTGSTCSSTVWALRRRTHVLSNGQVLWDFAGNLHEWIYEDASALAWNPSFLTATPPAYLFVELNTMSVANQALVGAPNSAWTSANGIGKINVTNLTGTGTLRGGAHNNYEASGVFMTRVDTGVNHNLDNGGFRCVFSP